MAIGNNKAPAIKNPHRLADKHTTTWVIQAAIIIKKNIIENKAP
jgi:hypothetical protein